MRSKISILDIYLTGKYKDKYYIITIDNYEKTLDIKNNAENKDIFDIGIMGTKCVIDISKDFDNFIKNIEKKYLND